MLGVPRGASSSDIKKVRGVALRCALRCSLTPVSAAQAYYALAKQCHPDTNKSADAETRFQELSKAYETLKDDDSRRSYDQLGHAHFEQASGGGGGGGGGGPGGGNPFGGGQGFHPFGAGFSGGRVNMNSADFEDIMGSFFGAGRPSRDISVQLNLDFMEAAKGARKSVRLPGGGVVELDIPAGVDSGSRLRVDGAGQPASGRQGAGHLYVTLNVREHPKFVREGPHLHVDATIGIDVAALGGRVTVPTLQGDAELTVPAGTQPGDTLRLRGKGLPRMDASRGLGDQLVHFALTVPKSLNARQKQLLQEFGELERNKRDSIFSRFTGAA